MYARLETRARIRVCASTPVHVCTHVHTNPRTRLCALPSNNLHTCAPVSPVCVTAYPNAHRHTWPYRQISMFIDIYVYIFIIYGKAYKCFNEQQLYIIFHDSKRVGSPVKGRFYVIKMRIITVRCFVPCETLDSRKFLFLPFFALQYVITKFFCACLI
jgi:hypothetical protein